MGKFYISAPVDEVLLAEAVAPFVEKLNGLLPSSEDLQKIAAAKDLDYATMVLYQAIHASPKSRMFIDAVNNEAVHTRHQPIGAKILFIPALFYGHYPETGADAKLARDIAAQCGFEVGTIPIKSVGTVTENAEIVRDAIEKETSRKVWIFAVSKGSADFRTFLQRYPDSSGIAKLRGWINVCGLPNGCQVADHNTATAWSSLKYRAICRLFGVSFNLMRELRTDHPYWQQSLAVPDHMKVFNFSAIPLGSHIQKSIIGRYMAIRHLGPNDGMVTCRDSIIDSAPTFPVWGCDHFFRSPQVMPVLYRFFSFLRTQCSS